MIPPEERTPPEVHGGLYVGEDRSITGLNLPFWAIVTGGGTNGRYEWKQVIAQLPSYNDFNPMMQGTVSVNPLYEVNGVPLKPGRVVRAQRATLDDAYDFAFVCDVGAGGSDDSPTILVESPEVLELAPNKRVQRGLVQGFDLASFLDVDLTRCYVRDPNSPSAPRLNPQFYTGASFLGLWTDGTPLYNVACCGAASSGSASGSGCPPLSAFCDTAPYLLSVDLSVVNPSSGPAYLASVDLDLWEYLSPDTNTFVTLSNDGTTVTLTLYLNGAFGAFDPALGACVITYTAPFSDDCCSGWTMVPTNAEGPCGTVGELVDLNVDLASPCDNCVYSVPGPTGVSGSSGSGSGPNTGVLGYWCVLVNPVLPPSPPPALGPCALVAQAPSSFSMDDSFASQWTGNFGGLANGCVLAYDYTNTNASRCLWNYRAYYKNGVTVDLTVQMPAVNIKTPGTGITVWASAADAGGLHGGIQAQYEAPMPVSFSGPITFTRVDFDVFGDMPGNDTSDCPLTFQLTPSGSLGGDTNSPVVVPATAVRQCVYGSYESANLKNGTMTVIGGPYSSPTECAVACGTVPPPPLCPHCPDSPWGWLVDLSAFRGLSYGGLAHLSYTGVSCAWAFASTALTASWSFDGFGWQLELNDANGCWAVYYGLTRGCCSTQTLNLLDHGGMCTFPNNVDVTPGTPCDNLHYPPFKCPSLCAEYPSGAPWLYAAHLSGFGGGTTGLDPVGCGGCSNNSPPRTVDQAPVVWRLTLIGGTGDFAAYNGTWDFTATGINTCRWSNPVVGNINLPPGGPPEIPSLALTVGNGGAADGGFGALWVLEPYGRDCTKAASLADFTLIAEAGTGTPWTDFTLTPIFPDQSAACADLNAGEVYFTSAGPGSCLWTFTTAGGTVLTLGALPGNVWALQDRSGLITYAGTGTACGPIILTRQPSSVCTGPATITFTPASPCDNCPYPTPPAVPDSGSGSGSGSSGPCVVPSTDCADCGAIGPGYGSKFFRVVVSGGTGDCAVFNGTWDFVINPFSCFYSDAGAPSPWGGVTAPFGFELAGTELMFLQYSDGGGGNLIEYVFSPIDDCTVARVLTLNDFAGFTGTAPTSVVATPFCKTVATGCCPDNPLPTTLQGTIAGRGSFALEHSIGPVTITNTVGVDQSRWIGSINMSGFGTCDTPVLFFRFYCIDPPGAFNTQWAVDVSCDGVTYDISLEEATVDTHCGEQTWEFDEESPFSVLCTVFCNFVLTITT